MDPYVFEAFWIHPGRLTWNLQISTNHPILKGKWSSKAPWLCSSMFHVNLHWCISTPMKNEKLPSLTIFCSNGLKLNEFISWGCESCWYCSRCLGHRMFPSKTRCLESYVNRVVNPTWLLFWIVLELYAIQVWWHMFVVSILGVYTNYFHTPKCMALFCEAWKGAGNPFQPMSFQTSSNSAWHASCFQGPTSPDAELSGEHSAKKMLGIGHDILPGSSSQ